MVVRDDIPVTFEYVDDFEQVIAVAKDDDMRSAHDAAHILAQLWARTPKGARQSRQAPAFLPDASDHTERNLGTPCFA